MKKTFKKQLVLFAAVMVMIMLALVIPASAAERVPCPAKDDINASHLDEYVGPLVYAPTCTQQGYTIKSYCEYCQRIVVGEAYDYQITDPTGHDFEVNYVRDGDGYKRVRTCKNELCQREETFNDKHCEEIIATALEDTEVYYLAKLVNAFEAPEVGAADHKSYYLESYYVPTNTSTWVLTGEKYDAKEYSFAGQVNVDGKLAAPDYEYTEDGELYLKKGTALPEYKGKEPLRGKDLNCGFYSFIGWEEAETKNGTKIYEAAFKENSLTLYYTFYDGDGSALTATKAAYYGETIAYGGLKNPTKKANARYKYDFMGWNVGNDGTTVYNDGEIKLYHSIGIYPDFDEIANKYDITMVDQNNAEVLKDSEVIFSETVNGYEDIDVRIFEKPRDVKYIYTFDGWKIKTVNGEEVLYETKVVPNRFSLPEKIQVKDKNTGSYKEIAFKDGDKLVLEPDYIESYYMYTIRVSVKPNRFEKEDVYSVGNVLTSDILDRFVIQVKDKQTGKVLAEGNTDTDGSCTVNFSYRDSVIISARTKHNTKYYGEQTINFMYCTVDDLKAIEADGVAIAPQITEEWQNGLKSCSCMCHSILSPILIRIYNVLNKIFGIEYACCEDLFFVHGDLLAYGPKSK